MASVKSIARRFNGYQQWGFKQTCFTVLYLTCGNPQTRWGICAGLSAAWIKEHALGGSLVKKLGGVRDNVSRVAGITAGAPYIHLNKPELRGVAKLHADASSDERGQTATLTQYLSDHGIVTRKRIHNSQWSMNSAAYTAYAQEDIDNSIAEDLERYSSCYVRISFGGTAFGMEAGHAVAVWLGATNEDACFFDPNYGEYWFENKNDFFRFFRSYYRQCYMRRMMRFDRRYELIPCALRMPT